MYQDFKFHIQNSNLKSVICNLNTAFFFSLIATQVFAQDFYKKINIEGEQREYIVHLPINLNSQKKHALLLVFHGGGGTAKNSLSFFGFNQVADTAAFIVVYPNGIKKGWNDGRLIRKHNHNDIGFIRQLIDQLGKDYPVDEKRVFATGISNGGFFSFALGFHLADKIRAIAPVCATIPEDILKSSTPAKPVSLLLINGTQDPLVPYNGGKVGGKWLNRGQCTSTDETVNKFIEVNQCNPPATQTSLPDRDLTDECTTKKYSYRCANENQVHLIRIEGGGHTWPGGKQYLGKRLVGRVCRDFYATTEVWNFFRQLK
ncbi:MAG: esterase [Bacteroidetes bacterium]|nr:esterase [Bacteroidota bacterium]MBI3481601.1 esterase [Bacteroidota bacterium]